MRDVWLVVGVTCRARDGRESDNKSDSCVSRKRKTSHASSVRGYFYKEAVNGD